MAVAEPFVRFLALCVTCESDYAYGPTYALYVYAPNEDSEREAAVLASTGCMLAKIRDFGSTTSNKSGSPELKS